MKIDRKLHLVIPITDDDRENAPIVAWVHSTPISTQTFDTFWKPISKSFAAIWTSGLGIVSGPLVADKILREISQDMEIWEGDNGVQKGLMEEIYRLTNVMVIGDDGWTMLPYKIAKRDKLSAEDALEVEAAIVFFILISATQRRNQVRSILNSAMALWGAQIESSNATEFVNFLRTSTPPAISGAKATS